MHTTESTVREQNLATMNEWVAAASGGYLLAEASLDHVVLRRTDGLPIEMGGFDRDQPIYGLVTEAYLSSTRKLDRRHKANMRLVVKGILRVLIDTDAPAETFSALHLFKRRNRIAD